MATRAFGAYSFESSNEDKVLFGKGGATKGALIDYYARIAETMLAHLRGRPIAMQRFPDGIETEGFYQKDAPDHFPDWIETVRLEKEGGEVRYVVCENAATLAYLANQGCITIHAWLSRRDEARRPDRIVFDLDPPDEAFDRVREAARLVADLLEGVGLTPFFQTTGSRGMHVVTPIERGPDFDEVRAFARQAMERLASRHDDALTTEARKEKRAGRLFLDTGRNAYAQTMVAPYSVRARPGAPVATPITREEIGRVEARTYTIENVFRRLGQREDPWAEMGERTGDLGVARERLGGEG